MMKSSQLTFLILIQFIVHGYSQVSDPFINAFQSVTGAQISLHRATGVPGFVRFPVGRSLLLSGVSVRDKGRAFLSEHGQMFGQNASHELQFERTIQDAMGHEHMTYQQKHESVPVFGALMRFHFDLLGRLQAINGVYVDAIKTSATPNLSAEDAEVIALGEYPAMELEIQKNELCFYRLGLAQGVDGPTHLAYEVAVTNHSDIREFIFVDAHDGKIIDRFTGIHGGLHRKVYEGSITPGNLIWEEGDGFPGSLDIWQQNEVVATEHSYNFFFQAFGFDGFDNAGSDMITINNAPINCPNASWNGTTTNYCTGTASDDVIAHEWGHAYTEYTSGLIYAWQAGALNESYSDIWGETIDLLNAYEDQDESHAIRTACSSSDRWRIGEDATAFVNGPIRDMWDPTCNDDPGKVSDPEYYCSSGDNGGVHSNSGVNNHAYALLVDGGTYNGYTISGLGFTKAAHIFWHAQRFYLTPTSDFSVQADALEASCNDLMGINLNGLTTSSTPVGPSGMIITATDLEQLQKVLAAVEMRMDPLCNFAPLLPEPEVILCAEAIPQNAIYYEDFETGLDGWIVSEVPTNPDTWEDREWLIEANLPDGRPGHAVFATDPINGNCSDDLQNGILRLESPEISVSVQSAEDVMMSFDHYVATESLWDGGNIKYKIGAGNWTLLPPMAFVQNSYPARLNTFGQGNDNPLQNEHAFTGTDEGSLSGSWAQSIINLTTLGVADGAVIQFRFELGTDGCNGRVGWYVDDIVIYQCADCPLNLNLAANLQDIQAVFKASGQIESSDMIAGASHIIYNAAQNIQLSNGFEINQGAELTILTDGCAEPMVRARHEGQKPELPHHVQKMDAVLESRKD